MLQRLSLRNIVLIEAADIGFEQGFCVLTGETGAGKSIILGALGLVMGRRAEASLVRAGESQGSVTATFNTPESDSLSALLEEQAIVQEDLLIIRRVIYADGKSKAFINDMPVTLGLLQSVAEHLVEIHGQHDQKGLMDVANHRPMLDAYAGLSAEVKTLESLHQQWKEAEKTLAAATAQAEQARKEQDYLEHALDELRALAPEKGEEETLADRRTFLMNANKIREVLQESLNQIAGQVDVSGALSAAGRLLQRSSVLPEGQYDTVAEALDRAEVEVGEAVNALEAALSDLEVDEHDIDLVEERLFRLREVARKYNTPVDELPEYLAHVEQQVAMITSGEVQLGALSKARDEAKSAYVAQAEQITAARRTAALTLERTISEELAPLKMAQCRVSVDISPLPEEKWSAGGVDAVGFLVATNPGSPLGALHKIASGGELSRFMLAFKVVMASNNTIPTLIFDEIDTGIGGAVADAVGKRLKQLSQQAQVLCVTHQPQVASYGSQHLYIEKRQEADHTHTRVTPLEGAARQEEIARMLAGASVTAEARAAAEKLMGAV